MSEILRALFVVFHPFFCKSLIFRAGAAVVRIREYAYSSAWSEQARYLNIFGVHKLYQVFHYLVYAVLMEVPVIAETEKVQLQALLSTIFTSGI